MLLEKSAEWNVGGNTLEVPAGIRNGFCALIKFDVSASSDPAPLLLSRVDDALAFSFVVGATFVDFEDFDRFLGAWLSAALPVFCFCSCRHFALLFLNQTWKIKKTKFSF